MVATDPVDARLLGVVAELGRAAIHEIAARVGMDPREVASRLVALSALGLPLLVGVECDPNGLRAALARANVGPPGVYAAPGGYQPPTGPPPAYGHDPPSVHQPPVPLPAPISPTSTWGPPQTSSWARGDRPVGGVTPSLTQPTVRTDRPNGAKVGTVGATLRTDGLDGERLAIQLIEVVDPADYLFTAAGYRLQDGERSVIVHTELANQGSVPFQTLPDLYLVLVTPDGQTISKAPVSLSSRPPHRIGIAPGETVGGHTVYVVPESTQISSVRWSPRQDAQSHALTWNVEP